MRLNSKRNHEIETMELNIFCYCRDKVYIKKYNKKEIDIYTTKKAVRSLTFLFRNLVS